MSPETIPLGVKAFSTLSGLLMSHIHDFQNVFENLDLSPDQHLAAQVLSAQHNDGSTLKEIHALGTHPVIDHDKIDPPAHTPNAEVPVDVQHDHRPLMEAARASAQLEGWSEAKTNAYLQAVHDNYDNLANGSAHDAEYGNDIVTVTTIDAHSREVVGMGFSDGKGGYGAERAILDLNHQERALQVSFSYTETDGKTYTETAKFADTCSNPILNETLDEIKPEAPAPVVPVKDPYAIYGSDMNCDCTDQVAVVTRDGVPADSVWTDLNHDGDYTNVHEVHGSTDRMHREVVINFDSGEFHGVDQATVDKDVAELQARGFKGNTIVYNVTDTEGKNVVACYNIHSHKWSIFSADHRLDPESMIPKGHSHGVEPILDGKTLMEDLNNQKRIA